MRKTITLKTGRTGGTAADGFQYRDRHDEISVGDYLAESLVTDTRIYEVVGVTPKGIRLRTTQDMPEVTPEEDTRVDQVPGLPVLNIAVCPDPNGKVYLLRVRKDGSVRMGSHAGAHPLRPARMINGMPVRRIDYRF